MAENVSVQSTQPTYIKNGCEEFSSCPLRSLGISMIGDRESGGN